MFIMEEDFTGYNGTNKSVEDMKEKILKVSAKISRAIRRCLIQPIVVGFWIVSHVTMKSFYFLRSPLQQYSACRINQQKVKTFIITFHLIEALQKELKRESGHEGIS